MHARAIPFAIVTNLPCLYRDMVCLGCHAASHPLKRNIWSHRVHPVGTVEGRSVLPIDRGRPVASTVTWAEHVCCYNAAGQNVEDAAGSAHVPWAGCGRTKEAGSNLTGGQGPTCAKEVDGHASKILEGEWMARGWHKQQI